MSLTIENGTGVAGANSYVTTDELIAYAESRGIVIPSDTAALEKRIINAMDYVEARSDGFAGAAISRTQALSWPRYGAYLDGYPILENEIPAPLKFAVLDIAARMGDTTLMPMQEANGKGAVIEQTVGPITTRYATPNDQTTLPTFPLAEAQLSRLMSIRGMRLTAYRG